jgi:hypothetical protein
MAETQTLKDEFQVSFFIKLLKIEGHHGTYYRLESNIKDGETEISLKYNNPEQMPISSLLEKFQKLYSVLLLGGNEKLVEGVREELLKLIALLLWNVYYL